MGNTSAPPVTAIYIKLTVMTLFWGGTFVAGRTAIQTMGPLSVALCRYAIATVLLLVLSQKVQTDMESNFLI